jgi:hypothetical protein
VRTSVVRFSPCGFLCVGVWCAQLLNVRLDPSSALAKQVRELTFTLENLDLLFKSEIPQ